MAFLGCGTANRVPEVVMNARPAVFSLLVDGETICTAFVVRGEPNYLLTAGHCATGLKDSADHKVFAFDSVTGAHYPVQHVRSIQHWPMEDFAEFKFTGEIPSNGVTVRRTAPEVGEDIYTIEGPLGFTPVVAAGIMSGRASYADDPTNEINGMYFISTVGTYGASGSPVFDSQGRVWGILVGGRPTLPGLCLVVLITN